MSLVGIVAEWFYIKSRTSDVPFDKQDSNIRDYYFRIARNEIQYLVQGYIGNKGIIANIVRGSVRDFINTHGCELTQDNAESLSKRILSNIRHLPRE